jgi:hypothetical protein
LSARQLEVLAQAVIDALFYSAVHQSEAQSSPPNVDGNRNKSPSRPVSREARRLAQTLQVIRQTHCEYALGRPLGQRRSNGQQVVGNIGGAGIDA